MNNVVADLLGRAFIAEEAIASTELENGPLEPRERYITKMSLTFPAVPTDVWGELYDAEHKNT